MNRPQFVSQFQDMCAAIKTEQGFNNTSFDGLWTTCMLDHPDYPVPETSGSAFFCFAMAWGVRNGLLDSAIYNPVINKAWRDLVKNIGSDGRLMRCQHVDWMPRADLSADVNNFLARGRGRVSAGGIRDVLPRNRQHVGSSICARSNENTDGLSVRGAAVALRLVDPSAASLKIFSANGRLALDLTSRVRSMRSGSNAFSLAGIGLGSGVYRIVLTDGNLEASSAAAVTR